MGLQRKDLHAQAYLKQEFELMEWRAAAEGCFVGKVIGSYYLEGYMLSLEAV